jgi:hypothetical protein
MASWGSVLSGVARHLARHDFAWRKISPGGGIFGLAKLTAQHVLSIRFVASKGYPRLDLAVSF